MINFYDLIDDSITEEQYLETYNNTLYNIISEQFSLSSNTNIVTEGVLSTAWDKIKAFFKKIGNFIKKWWDKFLKFLGIRDKDDNSSESTDDITEEADNKAESKVEEVVDKIDKEENTEEPSEPENSQNNQTETDNELNSNSDNSPELSSNDSNDTKNKSIPKSGGIETLSNNLSKSDKKELVSKYLKIDKEKFIKKSKFKSANERIIDLYRQYSNNNSYMTDYYKTDTYSSFYIGISYGGANVDDIKLLKKYIFRKPIKLNFLSINIDKLTNFIINANNIDDSLDKYYDNICHTGNINLYNRVKDVTTDNINTLIDNGKLRINDGIDFSGIENVSYHDFIEYDESMNIWYIMAYLNTLKSLTLINTERKPSDIKDYVEKNILLKLKRKSADIDESVMNEYLNLLTSYTTKATNYSMRLYNIVGKIEKALNNAINTNLKYIDSQINSQPELTAEERAHLYEFINRSVNSSY